MKDYTLNKKDEKKFILNYKIKKNKIFIKLASGERYEIPYNEENEEKILNMMKNQVTDNLSVDRTVVTNYALSLGFAVGTIVLAILLGIKSIPQFVITKSAESLISAIPTIACTILSSISAFFAIENKLIINDYKKNKLYLEREEEINNQVKNNKNILSNVSVNTKNIVYKAKEDDKVFNINKMDKVSLKDLKQILENIQRDEEFAFNYEESKPKKLTRKKGE